MIIDVTQEDIDAGLRYMCFTCPVALAINRALNYRFFVGAGANITLVCDTKMVFQCRTPDAAYYFMHAFDEGRPVAPFSFELPFVIQAGL